MGRGSHPVAVLFLSVVLLGICAHAARLPELERLSEVPAGDGAALKRVVDTYGRRHRPKPSPSPQTECDAPHFRKTVLKLIREMPFIGLFDDVRESSKFEASGMTSANGWLWVVFDNLKSIGRIDEHFVFRGDGNKLIGETGEDSQFEGLTYVKSSGHFLAVQEVVNDETHGLIPYVEEIDIDKNEDTYKVINKCHVHYELSHGNKGFEGLHLHEADNGEQFLMGLCEGNYCSGGKEGRIPGHGRIIVTKYNEANDEEDCSWEVVKEIHIPKAAYFQDYSGIAFRGDRVAVISQENSAVYVTYFDWEKLDFAPEKGETIYNFPRSVDREYIYCNVEGIEWLDDYRLVISSDKAKKDQPFRCTAKDQMVSIFALPG